EEEAKAKAESESPLMKEAREMLVKWDAGSGVLSDHGGDGCRRKRICVRGDARGQQGCAVFRYVEDHGKNRPVTQKKRKNGQDVKVFESSEDFHVLFYVAGTFCICLKFF
ncbi:MAG: hypothetical protein KHX30_01650, partial [Clostridium sp.]|nr:hypothetical protein [Clostridium sp.]